MATINWNNKCIIAPQIIVTNGVKTSSEDISANQVGEQITTEYKVTKVIADKYELKRVTALAAKARTAMLAFSTPGPDNTGLHLMDANRMGALVATVRDLQATAEALNQTMTVCSIKVDCLKIPVDLSLDQETAEKIRAHVQGMLTEMRSLVTAPDQALSPTQRYSLARNHYVKCQNLVSWTCGLNADIVRSAIDEGGDLVKETKSTGATSTPALDAAIMLFDTVDVEQSPNFAELPF